MMYCQSARGKWMAKRSLDVLQFSPSLFSKTHCAPAQSGLGGILVFYGLEMYVFLFFSNFNILEEVFSSITKDTESVCVSLCV